MAEATRSGAHYLEKKGRPMLIDVTEGAFLAERAREMNIAMRKLLYNYSTEKERNALKKQVRKRVKDNLWTQISRNSVVEEVTERLTDVAMVDPFYKKWFV
jgi:hypothetical protein